MNKKQRYNAMLLMLCLLLFGAFLFMWVELQTLGMFIIMFAAGFVLRDTLEPITEEST